MNIKKFGNSVKADSKAIYNAIDVSLGGTLELIRDRFAQTYKGYFEEKINNLVIDLLENEISENELLECLSSLNSHDKEVLFVIINKNLNTFNEVKRFLLSKIWLYKIQNGELNYFYSSLLTQLDYFVEKDFKLIYEMHNRYKINQKAENSCYIEIFDEDIKFTISKLFANGILLEGNIVGGGFQDTTIFFEITQNFEQLILLLKEYYSR